MICPRKVHPEFYDALLSGDKTFEIRKEDNSRFKFQVGDTLMLSDYDPNTQEYTDRPTLHFTITYVLRGVEWGVCEGYAVLGIKKLEEQ